MYYYNIVNNWDNVFKPHLSSNDFIRALKLYISWHLDDISKIYNNVSKDGLIKIVNKDKLSKDSLEIVDHLINEDSIYHYCVPHDCIELNGILMSKLCELVFPSQKFYVLTLEGRHTVISNFIPKDNKLIIKDISNNENGNNIFDLYYPCMSYFPFYKKTYNRYNCTDDNNPRDYPPTDFNVLCIHDINEFWSKSVMNYVSYY
jgi:hypothetical protein